jgi:uncharacterized protein (TIGR02246 family)
MCARCVVSFFLVALVFAGGCQRVQSAADSHKADIKALRDVEIAEEQAWSSKDLDKAVSFYADDAIVMDPNMPAVIGKENIRAFIKRIFADTAFEVQYQINRVDVAKSGDLGYTQGTLTSTMTDPTTGKPMSDRGTWLTVRKKQADGSWKIVQDVSSSDLPLSAPGK